MTRIYKLKQLLSIIICIFFILSSYQITYASDDTGGGVLGTFKDTKGFQALTFTVDPVKSTYPTQAFAIGWNVKILDESGEAFDEVYLTTPPQFTGTLKKYFLPLSKEFSHTAVTGGVVSASIESQIPSALLSEYKALVRKEKGSTFKVDACIQKYTYSSTRTPKYQPLSVYANNMDDINDHFDEFSDEFKNNLPGVYFDLHKTFAAEPKTILTPPKPKVTLKYPIDGTKVLQGTSVRFMGTGTGCHHIGGFVDDKLYEVEQLNPSEDINDEMTYETTVTLNELGKHTFYIVGRNAATGGDTDTSKKHTVIVEAPDPEAGTIYIKCLDFDTNKEIEEIPPIPNIPLGQAQTIDKPILDNYACQGSYQTYTFMSTNPYISNMKTETSQIVT